MCSYCGALECKGGIWQAPQNDGGKRQCTDVVFRLISNHMVLRYIRLWTRLIKQLVRWTWSDVSKNCKKRKFALPCEKSLCRWGDSCVGEVEPFATHVSFFTRRMTNGMILLCNLPALLPVPCAWIGTLPGWESSNLKRRFTDFAICRFTLCRCGDLRISPDAAIVALSLLRVLHCWFHRTRQSGVFSLQYPAFYDLWGAWFLDLKSL